MKKIAVIGGGITGLTAAFQLRQAGLHPLLFESEKQVGGAIRSESIDGFLIETGPNSLQDSPEEVSRLIRELDLEKEVIEAGPAAKNRFIVRDGVLTPVPSSPPALLRSKILSWKGKLRLLKEPFIKPPSADVEESLAEFIERRLGREALDYLVNPVIAGIYAGDPNRLSAKHALPKLFALEKEHGSLFNGMRASRKKKTPGRRGVPRIISFREGLSTLPKALASQLHQNIYLETTVETVTAQEDGRWELIAARHGRRLRDTFDAVILAIPATALSKITFTSETAGDDPSLHPLQEIHHPPVATVSLGFDRGQVTHPLDGFGGLFPEKEQKKILGVLFPSTLFPDRAPEGKVLLTCFIGGARQPDCARLPEEALVRLVLDDLRPLLGVEGEPSFTFTRLWPHAIPQYEVGHGRFLDIMESFEQTHKGVFIAGTPRDGISLGQCMAAGFRHADRAKKYLA